MKIRHKGFGVAERRQMLYPPLADLADALVHQHLGDPGPLKTYLERCAEVKRRLPKPPKEK